MAAQAKRLTASGQAVTGDATLLGWSTAENAVTAAAATVNIYRGTAATAANKVAVIELAANGSADRWLGPQGVYCRDGIFVELAAGSSEVIIYHG